MSVRQYIGARYVPRFSDINDGNWSSVYSYEPLIIVKNGNDYYTSKKSVPVGIQITNTEYWMKTGDYNGAIAALNTRLNTAESEISALKTEEGTNGSRYIFVGDSYNNPNYSNWGNQAATELGLSSSNYASLYVDGGSFVNNSFVSPIDTYAATLTSEEKAKVSNIIFLGGINDASAGGESAIITNMRAWITHCKEIFPNAKISIGFIGNSIETSSILHGRDYKTIAMALNIYEHCSEWGAHYLAGMEYILHDYSLMGSDGIHPTLTGGQRIAQYLHIALKDGEVHITSDFTSTNKDDFIDNSINVDSGIRVVNLATGDNQFMLNINRHDGVETFTMFGRFAVIVTSDYIQVDANKEFNIGKLIASNFINGKEALRIPVIGAAKDYNTPTSYHQVKGCLKIKGGLIKLHIDQITDDWTANKAVTQMLFTSFAWSGDTLLC